MCLIVENFSQVEETLNFKMVGFKHSHTKFANLPID